MFYNIYNSSKNLLFSFVVLKNRTIFALLLERKNDNNKT
jgi:hypothetical protein